MQATIAELWDGNWPELNKGKIDESYPRWKTSESESESSILHFNIEIIIFGTDADAPRGR